MVDAAGTLQARLRGRLVKEIEAAASLATGLPAAVGGLELERLQQALAGLRRGTVGTDRVEAL